MNTKSNPPAFQMYASDILGDPFFVTLSAQEFGCYCLLLLNLWVNGGKLKLDLRQIQRLCHLKSIQTTQKVLRKLRPRLNITRRIISSVYIDKQMQSQAEHRVKSIKGGLASGQKRSAKAQPRANPSYSDLQYINKIIKRLSDIWNQFSPKKITDEQLPAIRRLLAEETGPLHNHGESDLVEALGNYQKARQVPNSKAWEWNFYNFFSRGIKGYLPGCFDIDNYDPQKFKMNLPKGSNAHAGRKTISRSTNYIDPEAKMQPIET